MLYPKNVPNIERIARIILGLGLIGYAMFQLATGVPLSILTAGLLFGTAAFVIVTGFVGWCPACAMIGRKIKQNNIRNS